MALATRADANYQRSRYEHPPFHYAFLTEWERRIRHPSSCGWSLFLETFVPIRGELAGDSGNDFVKVSGTYLHVLRFISVPTCTDLPCFSC